MGIRLVYGLQTGDDSYLDIFYPSRRLKEAALAAGLDYAAIIHSPSDPPSRILDFCSGGNVNHCALLRGELPDSLYSHLESAGVRVINPAPAVALARDKLASAAFFESIGARHPRTLLAGPAQEALHAADGPVLPKALPFVAKPRYGKMGRDVALMEDVEQWTGYLAEARDKGQAIIAQEFIGSAPGRDVRFFFADFEAGPNTAGDGPGTAAGSSSVAAGTGSTPGWICVMRSSPGFLSNAHAGGTMTRFMPPVALQREAERIFSASGLVYGTVDFLFADGSGTEFVVCELNANPGFEELERATGVDAAAAIIKSVRNHADAGTTMHAVLPETPTPGKDGTA